MDREAVDEIKRHLGVVVEGLESKIQAAAEGVALNGERIDRLESGTNERFDRLGSRVDQLQASTNAGFARLEHRIDGIDQRVDRIEHRLEGVDQRIDGLAQRFDRIEKDVHDGFAEQRSLIQVTQAETDRRLTALETA